MDARRITQEVQSSTINPEDLIYIDSATNGSRVITYSDLCSAVASTLGIAAIQQTANGAMQVSTYDANRNGVVDNAEKLENHAASYFGKASDVTALQTAVNQKMTTSTYDSNGNGIVDNAEKVNNHTVYSDVPAQAAFTDTVYDDTDIRNKMGDLSNLETEHKSSLVAAINEVNNKATSGDSLGLTVQNGKLCAVYNT